MDASDATDLAPGDGRPASGDAAAEMSPVPIPMPDGLGAPETVLLAEAAAASPAGTESGVAWRIRPAAPEDVPGIDALVRELAVYEREPDAVEATPDDFRAALFGANPRVHCHVAEVSGPDGPEIAGIAVWYVTFSTWRGRHGIWLEDLFVRPAHRRLGLGRALLGTLAELCVERGYPRLEWWVLDWNVDAHDFYRSIGAHAEDEWTVWRVDDAALRRLGAPTP